MNPILVLDSSTDKSDDTDLVGLLDQSNIQRITFPSYTTIAKKISRGLQNVQTPYAALCADDDFLIPQSLTTCCDFLDRNQDYNSAHGIYVNHKLQYEGPESEVLWDVLYPLSRSNVDKSAFNRVRKFFPYNYSSYPFYAVNRTQELQIIWEETSKYTSGLSGWAEIFPMCLSIIRGKKTFYTVCL